MVAIAPNCTPGSAGDRGPVNAEPASRLLLSIVEFGGYPNFTPLYEAQGYEVVVESRMRKAISFLQKRQPQVIVAEFNFQSDFRDRTSSLESLLAVVQRMKNTQVIVFYDDEYKAQLQELCARLPVSVSLAFPIEAFELRDCLIKFG